MNFKHNKKRNSALLYEFLVRHISKCLIENKKDEANKALALSKKYFGEKSPLRKELALFNSVTKTTVNSKDSANKILKVVLNESSKLNARALDEQKSRLIKEANYSFGESFYDYKVPNYTLFASVQMLLNDTRSKNKILSDIDKIKLEDHVGEFLTSEKKVLNDSSLKINPNYSNSVYRIITEKFHKKYSGKLSEPQRRLLSTYVSYLISGNDKKIKESLAKESENIKKKLNYIVDENIKKDVDVMKKINESKRKFDEIKLDELSDKTLLEILQFMNLSEELESK